jgi:hypothetical protein
MRIKRGKFIYDFKAMEMYYSNECLSADKVNQSHWKLFPSRKDGFVLMNETYFGPQKCPHDIQVAWAEHLNSEVEKSLLE